MSINIDWSKAPEGFPLWLEGTNEEHRKHSGWYRDAGQAFEGASGGRWLAHREGQFFMVHRNPWPSIWSGEGLPPVGLEVEVVCPFKHPSLDKWHLEHVTIIAHDTVEDGEGGGDAVAVFKGLTSRDGQEIQYHSMIAGCFRPIRTPKQIAAEEREAGIAEIRRVLTSSARGSIESAIWDAGYRKQVAP